MIGPIGLPVRRKPHRPPSGRCRPRPARLEVHAELGVRRPRLRFQRALRVQRAGVDPIRWLSRTLCDSRRRLDSARSFKQAHPPAFTWPLPSSRFAFPAAASTLCRPAHLSLSLTRAVRLAAPSAQHVGTARGASMGSTHARGSTCERPRRQSEATCPTLSVPQRGVFTAHVRRVVSRSRCAPHPPDGPFGCVAGPHRTFDGRGTGRASARRLADADESGHTSTPSPPAPGATRRATPRARCR